MDHNGLDNAIDALLISEFMPASVVINHQMEIVQFRGTTDLFLTHPKGKATFNILKMARPEIAFELRNAISKVIKTKLRIRKSGIELKINSAVRMISLEIVPFKIESTEPLLLILFTEQEQTEIFSAHTVDGKNNSLAKDRRIKKLELELAAAHADALSIAQEQEAFAEELQSANEEVVSSNEELQTLNEELETSKEEIESANEELTTTNQELQTRNDLLNESYDYSEAVLATIHEPMIVLDKNLRVKSANNIFYKTFKVKEEETEGMLLYDLGNKQWNIPRLRELLEDILPRNSHFHNFEIKQTFPLIGKKTMLLNARRIIQKMNHEELILLALSDITERILAEKNRSLLSTVVESSNDAIISKTLDGTITSWNKGAEKIFGYRPSQAIGKSITMLIPPELMPEEDTIFDKIIKGQSVLHYDTIRVTKKGEKLNTSITVSPIKDKEGNIIGASKIARDITEEVIARKKMEDRTAELIEARIFGKREEDKFKAILESAPDAIVIVNSKGKIHLVNSNAEKLFGYHREEIIGKELELLMPARFKDTHQAFTQKYADHPKSRAMGDGVELFAQHKDGTEFPVEISLSSLQTEDGSLVSAAIREITNRKLIETELKEAKVSAENALKFKQQFLSNMSHEIRTPLNSILGFANVLLKTELGIEQKEFLHAIQTSGKSLNMLINDILDLAKVDAGKMTFEKQPFKIRETISSILHSFDLKIKEKNLELVREYDDNIPSMLLGDSLRLNQIILNLISNAVKFTHHGKIELVVKLLSVDEQQVTIEFAVSDSGIGIAPNKIDSIFNLFEQAELSTANSYGGTGLGLAIVKQLIEVQGGSISVRSKLGEGSTFSFIMPFGKTSIQSEEEIEVLTLEPGIKKLRVLVAEDVALNQLLIKIILSDFGFEYEIVSNGKMVIEKLIEASADTSTTSTSTSTSATLSKQSYDIILMDLQMPEMNGFEATEYIRKTMKSNIPIIALTADVTTADVAKCKAFGMDNYISKPINEKLLYNKIVELVMNKI